MSSFKEITSPNGYVISSYQHIDNGGYEIAIDNGGALHIHVGFFGYSVTELTLTHIDLRSLIDTLSEAEKRLNELSIVNKLKGL